MTTAPLMSGFNDEVSRQAAPGSAFPQVLPPRYPASSGCGKTNATGMHSGNNGVLPSAFDVGKAFAELHHPLITAADYSDRRQLLSHITVLSGQLQRAQLLFRNTPCSAVSDADLARFDPIIAQAEVDRLDSALAQLSLLHEMERARSSSLGTELHQLREERNRLVTRVDALETRGTTLEEENEKLREALEAAQQELEVLRAGESAFESKLHAIERLQRDGGRFDGVNVVIAPPRVACSAMAKELQLQETIERLSLLLEMMMDPIYIAFDAGVVWITETENRRATEHINGVATRNAPHDSEEVLTTGGGNSPLGNASDATVPQEGCANPSRAIVNEVRACTIQQQHDLCLQLDSLRERCRSAEEKGQRLQVLLWEEQQRTEAMAREHCKQLQSVYDKVVLERRQITESLVTEVEQKMRNAYREGRLYQKRLYEDSTNRRSSSTKQSLSGHSSARSSCFTMQKGMVGCNRICMRDGSANSSGSSRSPMLGG